jgi:hypothetical protein
MIDRNTASLQPPHQPCCEVLRREWRIAWQRLQVFRTGAVRPSVPRGEARHRSFDTRLVQHSVQTFQPVELIRRAEADRDAATALAGDLDGAIDEAAPG